MNQREKVLAVIRGEILDEIPSYMETCMDPNVVKELLPPSTGDFVRDRIAYAQLFDNAAIYFGLGINQETILRDDNQHTYRYETGAVWKEQFKPVYCREALSFPINEPDDVFSYKMPDALQKERIDDAWASECVAKFKDAGYYVQGQSVGAWQGIYYYLTSFDNILEWMITEPEAAHGLFDMTAKYSLDAAERVLGWGVDEIFVASDFGSSNSLLFSPGLFREYAFPWLKALADLCHKNGAYCHLHSHGHIEMIMDDIVEAGVDIINPIGPSDHNDLEMFKEKWGDKIVIHGGISTNIATMTNDEIDRHVHDVIAIGRKGGKFFPRSESGIPLMPKEKIQYYIAALKQERAVGYSK